MRNKHGIQFKKEQRMKRPCKAFLQILCGFSAIALVACSGSKSGSVSVTPPSATTTTGTTQAEPVQYLTATQLQQLSPSQAQALFSVYGAWQMTPAETSRITPAFAQSLGVSLPALLGYLQYLQNNSSVKAPSTLSKRMAGMRQLDSTTSTASTSSATCPVGYPYQTLAPATLGLSCANCAPLTGCWPTTTTTTEEAQVCNEATKPGTIPILPLATPIAVTVNGQQIFLSSIPILSDVVVCCQGGACSSSNNPTKQQIPHL